MYDLRVEVVDILGFCDQPMREGDYFEVRGGRVYLPEGRYFCLWALNSVLPMLPAKQRRTAENNDWLDHTTRISCPDPAGRVIMQIKQVDARSGNESGRGVDTVSPYLPSQGCRTENPPARLLTDSELCVDCGRCQQVCSQTSEDGISRIIPSSSEEFRVCRQCGNARCVQACPEGALYREPDTHAVGVSTEKCTGCGLCAEACPFDAVTCSEVKYPAVCDLCGGKPQCANVCPSGAIRYAHNLAH